MLLWLKWNLSVVPESVSFVDELQILNKKKKIGELNGKLCLKAVKLYGCIQKMNYVCTKVRRAYKSNCRSPYVRYIYRDQPCVHRAVQPCLSIEPGAAVLVSADGGGSGDGSEGNGGVTVNPLPVQWPAAPAMSEGLVR